MQRSKQCSLSFCKESQKRVRTCVRQEDGMAQDRIGLDWDLAYLDESASVCNGGLLAHLLHDFGLCVHF
jgi:hypothetical protein